MKKRKNEYEVIADKIIKREALNMRKHIQDSVKKRIDQIWAAKEDQDIYTIEKIMESAVEEGMQNYTNDIEKNIEILKKEIKELWGPKLN